MNNYTLWAKIRRMPDGQYVVSVEAMPVNSNVFVQPGDRVAEECDSLPTATAKRDVMVRQLKNILEERGDRVVSVDSTLGL